MGTAHLVRESGRHGEQLPQRDRPLVRGHLRAFSEAARAGLMANTSGADSQYGLGGFSPVLQANRHGIQEGISSDNELSYGHDLFTEMRTLLTVQRGLSFAAE